MWGRFRDASWGLWSDLLEISNEVVAKMGARWAKLGSSWPKYNRLYYRISNTYRFCRQNIFSAFPKDRIYIYIYIYIYVYIYIYIYI